MTEKSPGQRNYEAAAAFLRLYQIQTPAWHQLKSLSRQAWHRGAAAVLQSERHPLEQPVTTHQTCSCDLCELVLDVCAEGEVQRWFITLPITSLVVGQIERHVCLSCATALSQQLAARTGNREMPDEGVEEQTAGLPLNDPHTTQCEALTDDLHHVAGPAPNLDQPVLQDGADGR